MSENTQSNSTPNTTVVDTGHEGGQQDNSQDQVAELRRQLANAKKAQAGSDLKVTELLKELAAAKQLAADAQAAAQALTLKHEEEAGAQDNALTGMQAQIAALIAENEARKRAEAEAKREAGVANLVATEFPDLSGLMAQGAMPQAATIEELRAKLSTIQELVQKRAETHVQEKIKGMRPAFPSATGSGDGDVKSLERKLEQAAAAKDWTLYSQLSTQWSDLHK